MVLFGGRSIGGISPRSLNHVLTPPRYAIPNVRRRRCRRAQQSVRSCLKELREALVGAFRLLTALSSPRHIPPAFANAYASTGFPFVYVSIFDDDIVQYCQSNNDGTFSNCQPVSATTTWTWPCTSMPSERLPRAMLSRRIRHSRSHAHTRLLLQLDQIVQHGSYVYVEAITERKIYKCQYDPATVRFFFNLPMA